MTSAAVLILALALAGCGGGGAGGAAAPSAGSTSTSTSTSTEPSATPTSTAPSAPSATATDYLPVPPDRTLTPPGTDLPFREGALVAWQPRQDLVGVVGVEVLRVERSTVADLLDGYDLDAQAAASTPYLVTMKVGNGGDTDLGGRTLPVYVVDSEQRLVPPTGTDRTFAPCRGSVLPPVFAPGDAARSCLLFLVPDGASLASVMFRPPEGVVPITWTGPVKDLGKRGGTRGRTPR